jgi:hypothetical protein
MKDFVGKNISLLDIVAFCQPNYRNLIKGTVYALTEQRVRVKFKNHYETEEKSTYTARPEDLIVISHVGE